MVWVALAPVLLLDVHLGFALDRWRARWGPDVRRWLDALGHMEALSSLATLGHDHPDWSRPEWKVGESVLRAAGLGHPLLVPATCVRNDLEVGPPGTFLFITGSNMSGKSTLLRAVGANVVLAGAGAPVCATSLTLPPVRLWTSMRVDDSLADGVSRFMAELLRVRAVVEAARDAAGGEAPVLYLLDEMLQGTNTAERRVAARAVLRHLLEEGAIGGITSHDLTLADAPDLEPLRRAYHFREQVGRDGKGTVLTFDYVLRPGVATTRNALRLLEAVGLGHADAPAAEDVDEGPGSGGGT
jgi:DNA mismatch repair ATPase MutS